MEQLFNQIADGFANDLIGQNQYPIPPLKLILGSGNTNVRDYLNNTAFYTGDFIKRCFLKRNHRVLEIGCGSGKIASGLINYFNIEGEYIGLDVDRENINWCDRNLSIINSNFQFYCLDIVNNYYYEDDNGKVNSYDFSFLEDRQFDRAIALSVFNHLRLSDTKAYLQEIGRRLTIDGLGYLTFFSIDEYFREFQKNNNNFLQVKEYEKGVWYGYTKQKSFAGYEPEFLMGVLEEANLRIIDNENSPWQKTSKNTFYPDLYLVERIK